MSRPRRGPQAVRLLDIPADAGKGFGAFDHAGPDNDAARLSDALKRAARTSYGTAGPAFIKRLAAENSKEAARHITAAVEAFVDSHATAGSDGQVIAARGQKHDRARLSPTPPKPPATLAVPVRV